MYGGASYASVSGRRRVEPAILDAFGLASLAAAMIILTGGLLGVAVRSLRQTTQPRGSHR
jgi:hypothetical protein